MTATSRPANPAGAPGSVGGAGTRQTAGVGRLREVVVGIGRGLWNHDVSSAASSMAFNFFLSLIPLLVLLGFVLGHFIRENGVDEFMGPFLDTVPAASAEIVRKELERLAGTTAAGSVGAVSIAGFLWLTSSGIHHMMDVFEGVARATARPWWKQRAIALGTVVGCLLTVCLTTWIILEVDAQLHVHEPTAAAQEHPRLFSAPAATAEKTTTHLSRTRELEGAPPPNSPPGQRFPLARAEPASSRRERKRLLAQIHSSWENYAAIGVMLAIGLSGLAAFYRYAVEHPSGVQRRAWPGAIVAMGSWLVVSWGFGNYVISLGKYAVYYGSLAAVAVLLVWLWLTSLALLLGAEVNAQLEGVGR